VDWLAEQGIGYTPTANVEDALALLRQEQTDAVVYDAPILDFHVRSDPSGSLVVVDRRFDFHWYAFAVPPGSKMTEQLNREILEITGGKDWRKHILEVVGREP
jgi:ABC-type amino acid transport substrate-binding protein